MKNLFLIITTVLSFTINAFAINIINSDLAIIKTEEVELILETVEQKEFILSSKFDVANQNLALTFETSVKMILIYNMDGEIETMLPIDSKKLNLGFSLFDDGQYKMGFILEGIEDIQITSLIIKR